MTMPQFRSLLFAILIAFTFSACSDDEPTVMTHYYNPLFTPDGKTVIAGYWQETGLSSDNAAIPAVEPTTLAVMAMDTRQLRTITLPVPTRHKLYSFDPSGTALAFVADNAIAFYDLSGNELLRNTPGEGGIPMLLTFSNTGNSFIWVGSTQTNYTLNQAQYSSGAWTIDNNMTLLTFPKDSEIIALTMTSQRSAALRFADGAIVEYDLNGDLLHSFTVTPFTTVNPWQQRLMYFARNAERYLYVKDGSGLHRLDLVTGLPRQLVKGEVVDMDISALRSTMVYETGTGDTWIATTDGSPLTRIAPQNLMPRISPAGNGIAMVARIDSYTDSLHILLLR